MRKKLLFRMISMVGVFPMLFTGCGLLPKEEELPAAPIIHSFEMNEYVQTIVLRGDLTREKTVRCDYVPTKQENLGFSIGGEFLEKIYVSKGQEVKAGELLAELDSTGIADQIDSLEYRLEVLKLQKDHLAENHALSLRRKKVELELADEETLDEELAKLEEVYQEQLQDIEDALYIEGLKLEELKTDLEKRQLRAGIDGTVTYVKEPEEGERSVEGRIYVSISDMSSSVFEVSEKDAEDFSPGTQVIVTCGEKEYLAVAEEQEEKVYLALTVPDPTLEKGDHGVVQLILEHLEDVCYLDKDAIRYADNRTFVYVLDEDGWKVMQDVVIGMENDDYVEIRDGLQEGDSVVLD